MRKFIALTFAALVASAVPAGAAVVYAPTAISASPRTSDYGTVTGGGFRTFDNFSVAGGAAIERLSWRGIWFGDTTPAPAPDPVVDNWLVAFHASTGGVPGAVLWSQNIAAADVVATFRGTGVLTVVESYNAKFYDYALDLPSVFNALAGEEYWVSVMAIADTFNPVFAILGATGGDDSSYQQLLGANMAVNSAGNVARDRAFTIEGTLFAVPEPGTLALCGIALAVLARRGAARRRAA